ncbi:MAG: bifunctional 2-polyprenyl-6-hydroxyphenol methylase/3-demethylubiquinol 3-O-methyltransferase UbiG [Pseudomonadota bacterium]
MTALPEHAPAPSVDPREVAHYTALADTWWDRTGPFWPLHRLNELRRVWIAQHVADQFERDLERPAPLAGLKMLDVGCGGGILSESMAALGATVTGIDVVEKNIRIAQRHAEQQSGRNLDVGYACTSAEALAEVGEKFDVVLNMEVVEHVADLPGFMDACNALVAPGGQMYVSTLNRTPKSWLFGIIGAEYVMRWLPRGTHRWSLFRTPKEIEDHLARGGLIVKSHAGVSVNPFTRGFSIVSSLKVNYMLCAAKPAP